MAVTFGHCRAFCFVDYRNIVPSMSTLPVKAVYFLTGFGHQAVMVFFVLSGLFISSSVLRSLERGTWRWRDYVIDRGVRLYVVLAPGLLLGALWDLVGVHFFNHSGIYSAPLVGFDNSIPAQQLNLTSFFGSLFFLQTRFTTVFGSNCPLWSLFNEFWYYVLFPLLIAVILSAKRRSITVIPYVGGGYSCRLGPRRCDFWVCSVARRSWRRADFPLFAIWRIPSLGSRSLHNMRRDACRDMFDCRTREPRIARIGPRRGPELCSVDTWDRTVKPST
jgi:hypothetical protein